MNRSAKEESEKRGSQRVPVKLKVDWKSAGNFLFEHATNISEQGIFIETESPMEPGTAIDLQFQLPEASKKIEVRGEVTWVNPVRPVGSENYNPGMGIRFTDLKEGDKDKILSLVKRIAVL